MATIVEKYSATLCSVCGGLGYIRKDVDDGIFFEECVCVKIHDAENTYREANIPRRYWHFGLEDLNAGYKKKNAGQLARVDDYIKNLDMNIEQGEGLWFCSAPGLGKSTAIVSILKAALVGGHCPYFIRASRIIKYKFEALRDVQIAKLLEFIVDVVDILAIEEFDKLYLSGEEAMNNQLFYEFMEDVYDRQKSLLLSSNMVPRDVMGKYPTFIQDRLRSLKPVIFTGLSERRTKSKL